MSAQKLNYSSFRKCQSETEIRNIFERHMRTLLDFKRKMINEITEWETNLIRQIQQNVINQKNFLENEYKLQLQDLEIKCQEFLDTALIYEEKKNRDEVRRLIEQCHIYKIELGTFEYPEKLIPFIELSKNKQDLSTIPKYNETSTMNNEFDVRTNKTSHSSISSNPAFANANRINQKSLINDKDHFKLDNDTIDSHMRNYEDIIEKCPACFIIFPSTMGMNERSQHVNQHFEEI